MKKVVTVKEVVTAKRVGVKKVMTVKEVVTSKKMG